MSGPLYRPRMRARLEVPSMGDGRKRAAAEKDAATVYVDLRVRRATLEVNDHLTADTLELSAEWNDAGIDPRILAAANVTFWLGEADDQYGAFRATDDNLRFQGVLTEIERDLSASGRVVTLKAHDFTDLFISCNGVADKAAPKYSDTLAQAWRKICEHTGYYNMDAGQIQSSVEALADRLTPIGDAANAAMDLPLAHLTTERAAKLGAVFQVKPHASAWDIWQQVVGAAGLFSFVKADKVILTDPDTYFNANGHPPRFIWGNNVLSMKERRNSKARAKGIMLQAIEPTTHHQIQAFYPDRATMAKLAESKKAEAGGLAPTTDYTPFPFPGVATQAALDAAAKSVWEQSSRQELEGSLTTREMRVDRYNGGDQAELLKIDHGAIIRVEFEQDLKADLRALGSEADQLAHLIAQGYSDDTAQVMVQHMADFGGLQPDFCVRKIHTTFAQEETGLNFEVSIDYANRIQLTGDAQ